MHCTPVRLPALVDFLFDYLPFAPHHPSFPPCNRALQAPPIRC